MTVYFDNAATTRVSDEAAKKVMEMMCENYGNPSSTHTMGRAAKEALNTARKNIANALDAQADEIFFTSGGTEADNWAVFGAADFMKRKGRHIITTAVEHDAILKPMKMLEQQGWDITYLKPDRYGRIPPEHLAETVRKDTVLVSVMLVNNETGACNQIDEYAHVLRRTGSQAILHTDAVQGFCKMNVSVKKLGAEIITVSSHKIHGPKGAGALYIKSGLKLSPLLFGGGQEEGRRPGTEALPVIAGFGEAARLAIDTLEETVIRMNEIREYIIGNLRERLPAVKILGAGDAAHILSISLPGYKSEVLMNFLESADIYVSKSSACKKGGRSHVLAAMALPNDIIDGTIRLSFSKYSTIAEADYFIENLYAAKKKLFPSLR